MATPITRYRPSPRAFPEQLPPLEYHPSDAIRRVQGKGEIVFKGHAYPLGRAFTGERIGLRTTQTDGLFDVFFGAQRIAEINLIDHSISLNKRGRHAQQTHTS